MPAGGRAGIDGRPDVRAVHHPGAGGGHRRAERSSLELGHHYIGTEHLLLALLEPHGRHPAHGAHRRRPHGRAGPDRHRGRPADNRALGREDAEALEAIGIDLDAVRAKIEESFGPGALTRRSATRARTVPPPPALGPTPPAACVPFVPRSKKVLELSLREAIRLHHNYIGTEHILLGLIREGEGLAAKIICDAGIDLDDLRRRTLDSLPHAA